MSFNTAAGVGNAFFDALAEAKQDPVRLMLAFMQRYSIEQGGALAPERFVREILLQQWGEGPDGRILHLGPMMDPEDPTKPAEPDVWQAEVLGWYGAGERRIAIKSGHGVGKSTCMAWICWHQLLTRIPQKIAITAPTSSQLFDALFPEIGIWMSKLPAFLKKLYNKTGDRIELMSAPDDSYLTARTSRPETPEALAGIHSKYVLLIGDEASGIPNPVYEAASGSMSGESAVTILPGNPVRTSGLFFDIFHKPEMAGTWKTKTVSCLDSRRVSKKYVEDMKARYGEQSNAFRVRVLGEFPLAGQSNIISYESLAAAEGRDIRVNPSAPTVWGLDVARFGGDKSALCKRKGNAVLGKVETWSDLDLMQLCAVVKADWDRTPPSDRPVEILIDSIGMGAGVVDRLRQLQLPAFGINVSESAAMSDQYLNLRAELWFEAKAWFARMDSTIPKESSAYEGDSTLLEELSRVQYKFTKTGKLQAESKDEMKKRGFASPNKADAFVLTLASVASVLVNTGNGQTVGWGQPLRRNIKGVT